MRCAVQTRLRRRPPCRVKQLTPPQPHAHDDTMTDADRYADLSRRSVFSLSREEHEWLLAHRRKLMAAETADEWFDRQASGFGAWPHEAYGNPIMDWAARAWRWVRGR